MSSVTKFVLSEVRQVQITGLCNREFLSLSPTCVQKITDQISQGKIWVQSMVTLGSPPLNVHRKLRKKG